jgi:hypothetical protein
MQKLRKIIGLALTAAMLLCFLASCGIGSGQDPQQIVKDADAALKAGPYNMDVLVKYTSESDELTAAIQSFSTPHIKVNVDGESFKATLETQKDLDIYYIKYTFVDGILYAESYDGREIVKEEKSIGMTEKAELLATFGSGADIGIDDFNEVVAVKEKKVSVITCTGIKAETLDSLIAVLDEQLASVMEADVAIKDAALVIEVEDGKYKSATLTCLYYITTADGSYAITMNHTTAYSYDYVAVIAAPMT